MILVQEKQLVAMGDALEREQFEDEMIAHLRGFSPWHAGVIGDAGLRRVIRLGIDRAGKHGVTSAGGLRFFFELMVMFGSLFDTDPLVAWAGKALRDPGVVGEAERVGRLYGATRAYLDAVNGAERSASLDALRRIQGMLREDMPAAVLLAEHRAVDTMRRIHPTFCTHVGEPALRDLVRRGHEAAGRLDVATDGGVVLVIGMMFTIGHGFAEDPLFPWVRATLRDPALRSPDARVARLGEQARLHLARAVEHFEGRRADAAV